MSHDVHSEAWYVFDGTRDAVVAGPFDDMDQAKSRAACTEGRPYVVDGELLEKVRDDTTLVWETGDVDVVTDGGTRIRRYKTVDSVQQLAGVGIQGRCSHGDPECPGQHGDGLPCWECLVEGGDSP